MSRRIIWMIITIAVAFVLLNISRFWMFELASRAGLFGIKALRPQGGLLAQWLRGTPLAPFELVIWMCGTFLALTWVEKLYGRLISSEH